MRYTDGRQELPSVTGREGEGPFYPSFLHRELVPEYELHFKLEGIEEFGPFHHLDNT